MGYNYLFNANWMQYDDIADGKNTAQRILFNTKKYITDNYSNKGQQLKKIKSNYYESIGIAPMLTQELEQNLVEIMESVWAKVSINNKIDLTSLNSYIAAKELEANELVIDSKIMGQIQDIINQIRSSPIYQKSLMNAELEFCSEFKINVQNITQALNGHISDGHYIVKKSEIIDISKQLAQLSSLATQLYNKHPDGGKTSFAKALNKGLSQQSIYWEKGEKTLEYVFKSYDGYLSQCRGLAYELAVCMGYIDSEIQGIEGVMQIGDLKEGGEQINIAQIKLDKQFQENKKALDACKQSIKNISTKFKGLGKTDVAMFFDIVDNKSNAKIQFIAQLSVKSSNKASLLQPDGTKNYASWISLGGFNYNIEHYLTNDKATHNIFANSIGRNPLNYTLNLVSAISQSKYKKETTPYKRTMTLETRTQIWQAIYRSIGILNLSDALIGQIRKKTLLGGSDDYFVVNQYVWDSYDLLDAIYKKFLESTQNNWAGPITIKPSVSKDVSDKWTHEIQEKYFKLTKEEAQERSKEITGAILGSIEAKIQINQFFNMSLNTR